MDRSIQTGFPHLDQCSLFFTARDGRNPGALYMIQRHGIQKMDKTLSQKDKENPEVRE